MERFLRAVAALVLLYLAGRTFLYSQNNWLTVTHQEIISPNLPDEFAGFTIVHLSDLHGQTFGPGQSYLLRQITGQQPDIVVCTGDMVDANTYDPQPLFALLDGLAGLPVYYVSGNHEMAEGRWTELSVALRQKGVKVLTNSGLALERDGQTLRLAGLDDPSVRRDTETWLAERLAAVLATGEEGEYTILLAHRPEYFSLYAAAGADLTLSGHAHGGQVIIPFVGGLIAPGQGYFPEYYAGVYQRGEAALVVSRGLGNSVVKQRLFNRPEVVVITLRK